MKLIRQLSLTLLPFLLTGVLFGQSLPELMRVNADATSNRPHARKIITNDDIPSAPAPEQARPAKPGPAAEPARADKNLQPTEAEEVCRYVAAIRSETQQLERRVQKLQQAIAKEESELLRNVYGNALIRLTESLQTKQQELMDASQTPDGASCTPAPEVQKPTEPPTSKAAENL
jgi:hypothetical protein